MADTYITGGKPNYDFYKELERTKDKGTDFQPFDLSLDDKREQLIGWQQKIILVGVHGL